MPSSDFALLAGYSRVEPFGVRRDDWHHARTQATISTWMHQMFYVKRFVRSKKSYSPQDFMYKRKKTEAQKSVALFRGLESLTKKK